MILSVQIESERGTRLIAHKLKREQWAVSARGTTLAVLLFAACAATNHDAIPNDERLLCRIEELHDLTGAYKDIVPSFEDLMCTKLKDDFTFHVEPSVTQGGAKTIFVANRFSATTNRQLQVRFIIEGEVEQIQYGRPTDIHGHFVDYWLFGILGETYRTGVEEVKRAALLEYRIRVLDAERRKVATVIVQGICEANVDRAGRERIINSANKVAAERLAWVINNEVAEKVGLVPRRHMLAGERPDAYPSALWATD